MGVIIGYALLFIGSLCSYFFLRKKKWQHKNYLLIMAVTGGVCLVVSGMEQLTQQESRLLQLERNEAGEGAKDIQVLLEADGLLQQYPYSISVEEQQITEEQAGQIFEEAKQELETAILGENKSLEEISGNLNVPSFLLDGLVKVSCSFEPYTLVDVDGTVLWENLEENTGIVKVIAQMSCQKREATHEFYLQLVPAELGETEALMKEIDSRIQSENQSQGEEYLKLPQEINGVKLSWYDAEEPSHVKVLLLGMVVMVCWYVYGKEKKEKEEKDRKQKLILDYPDIVSRLSLLSGAGMTISAAWAKVALEYKKQKETGRMVLRPGYEEVLKTWYEMQDGIGEIKAYENFGMRCALPQYRKFASLLMQNVRKGTRGMQQLLDAEAKEAFQQRKLYAKQLGEEAGTKLLIPMGVMLILVFAILMLPAMLALNL